MRDEAQCEDTIMDFVSKDKGLRTTLTKKVVAAIEQADIQEVVEGGLKETVKYLLEEDEELYEAVKKAATKAVLTKLRVTFEP